MSTSKLKGTHNFGRSNKETLSQSQQPLTNGSGHTSNHINAGMTRHLKDVHQGKLGPSILFLGFCVIVFSIAKIYQAQQCTILLAQPMNTGFMMDYPPRSGIGEESTSLSQQQQEEESSPIRRRKTGPPIPDEDPDADAVLAEEADKALEEAEQQRQQKKKMTRMISRDNTISLDNNNNSTATTSVEEDIATIDVTPPPHTIKQVLVQRKKVIDTAHTMVKGLKYKCTLQTQAKHAKVLARIIVLQRDGRHQLRDFVNHYTKVLPYDSMVLMDHESTDEYSKALLQEYGAKGAHIWTCTGPFDAKRYMWTHVTRVYGKDSGFVFNVDIDELLAVHVQRDDNQNNNNNDDDEVSPQTITHKNNVGELQWNVPALGGALKKLGRDGKPYKLNWIESLPAECLAHMSDAKKEQLASLRDDQEEQQYAMSSSSSSFCDIQYVKVKDEIGCMDKTFSRGFQFYKTDTGNHYGGTRRFKNLTKALCETKGLESIYELSTLALVHLKEKTFEDWLIHGLRGATDRGFHKDFNIDCSQVEKSVHYCKKWEKITKAKFSPYVLRKIFVEDVCPPEDVQLMPAHKVFCEAN